VKVENKRGSILEFYLGNYKVIEAPENFNVAFDSDIRALKENIRLALLM